MAETNPNDRLNDELLSAYVDGELDEAQLEQVEQRLRDDPTARRLVDELQALSATMQSVPKEAVGQDLREIVLKQAERTSQKTSSSTTSATRRWAWAAMALAAALLLMFIQPESEQAERQMAAVESRAAKTRVEPTRNARLAAGCW